MFEGVLALVSPVLNPLSGAGASVPVERVPPEVLCEIVAFFGVSRNTWDSRKELANLAKRDLLLLAQVCSHWHSLIMGTPALWTEIEIHACHWRTDPKFLRVLQGSLERSNGSALTLKLNLDGAGMAALTGLLDLLNNNCSRWERLHLCIEPERMDLLQPVKGRLGMLRELSLCYAGMHRSAAPDVDIFQEAPNLTEVHLDLQKVHGCPRFPWSQLRLFTYQDSGNMDFATIMHKLSPSAATFRFHHIAHMWEGNVPTTSSPITSEIQNLCIDLTAAPNLQEVTDYLGSFMDSLTLSSLHGLNIVRRGFPLVWPLKQFTSLAERSFLRLTLNTLDILGVQITPAQLIRTLQELPVLRELAIADHPLHALGPGEFHLLTDAILQRLTWSSSAHEQCLIPRLLHLRYSSLFGFTPHIFRDFVTSRIALTRVPFEITLTGPNGTSIELADKVAQELQPLVTTQELNLNYTRPERRTEKDYSLARNGTARMQEQDEERLRRGRHITKAAVPAIPKDVVWG